MFDRSAPKRRSLPFSGKGLFGEGCNAVVADLQCGLIYYKRHPAGAPGTAYFSSPRMIAPA